jgi:hypothetical protein
MRGVGTPSFPSSRRATRMQGLRVGLEDEGGWLAGELDLEDGADLARHQLGQAHQRAARRHAIDDRLRLSIGDRRDRFQHHDHGRRNIALA